MDEVEQFGIAPDGQDGRHQRGARGDQEFGGQQPQPQGHGAAVRRQGGVAELVAEGRRAEQPRAAGGSGNRRGHAASRRGCGVCPTRASGTAVSAGTASTPAPMRSPVPTPAGRRIS
ncbi:DEAD/DEAH box helicase family protein [Streptomyces viridosporus]|uniref:hypothetical protein n=1 Tax=Streptomyces viridosporus TaxID=67581 RepID=UPI000380CC02